MFYLLASPILQGVGRLRAFWREEDTSAVIIDNHAAQLQRLLLPYLGPAHLTFPVTPWAKDTEDKAAAFAIALSQPKETESSFLNTLDMRRRQRGISRQARMESVKRIVKRNAFSNYWRRWWEETTATLKRRDNISKDILVSVFTNVISQYFGNQQYNKAPPLLLN